MRFTALVVVAAATACGPPLSDQRSGPQHASVAAQPADPRAEERHATNLSSSHGDAVKPGSAYLAVEGEGFVEILPDGTTRALPGPELAFDDELEDFIKGNDGVVYAALRREGLHELRGGDARRIAPAWHAQSLATDSYGVVWALANSAVVDGSIERHVLLRIDKGKVEVTPLEDLLGADGRRHEAIAVDRDDRLWIAAGSSVFVGAGETWSKVDDVGGRPRQLIQDPAEAGMYVLSGAEVTRIDSALSKSAVGELPEGQRRRRYRLAVGNNPFALAYREDGQALRLDLGADDLSPKTPPAMKDQGILAATVDDRGRAWIARASSLAVVHLDESAPGVEWKTGDLDVLSGPVRGLVVLEGGPKLPAAVPSKPVQVKGRVVAPSYFFDDDTYANLTFVDGRAPVGDTELEACRVAGEELEVATPCSGAPEAVKGRSEKDGTVALSLYPGRWTIAVRVHDGWRLAYVKVGRGPKQVLPDPIDLTMGTDWLGLGDDVASP